jgi:signal transduction histidine kinase
MLKKTLSFVAIVVIALSLTSGATFNEAEKTKTKDLVNAAIAHINKVGINQAFHDIQHNDSNRWVDGDLYIFVFTIQGKCLVHPLNPLLVGKDMSGLRDSKNRLFIAEFGNVVRTKGEGWVEYQWKHYATNTYRPKISFVKGIKDRTLYVGAGIYGKE